MRNSLSIAVLITSGTLAFGQATSSTPVQTVVTVEARHGDSVPDLNRQDFMAFQGKQRLSIGDAVPLRGDSAGLELYLLMDDSTNTSVGIQLADLRKFIEAQPASSAIGVGYMRNGTVQVAQKPTTDHALAAKALRLPLGSGAALGSPYWSVSDLVKHWPAGANRRDVLMITDGVDPYGGFDLNNPYVDAAIEDCQRAGVAVYAIYTPGSGHAGHSRFLASRGQDFLAKIAEETGGESYYIGFGPPVSFAPYLAQLSERLKHQYLVTLEMPAAAKGKLEQVKFATEVPNAELVAAEKVYVSAAK